MSDTYFRCKNCYKDLKSNAILKHLCQKPTCKDKYSTLEYNDLVETARKRSKEKKKIWKRANYDPDKRSEQHKVEYNKAQIKSHGHLIENHYQAFLESRGKIMDEILSQGPSHEVKDQIKNIHEIINKRKSQLDKIAENALLNFKTTSHSKLHDELFKKWEEAQHEADEILKNVAPEKYRNPEDQSHSDSDDKIECKSCHERFEENSILKHLVKVRKCMEEYQDTRDLKELQEKANNRVKERSKKRYQDEKEIRAEQYREKRKGILKIRRNEINLRHFNASKDHLKRMNLRRFDDMWLIQQWKSSNKNSRGAQCRREIDIMKQSRNADVQKAMENIEGEIHSKISELEACYKEVAKEVEDTICHYEYDEDGSWKKQVPLEQNFMFQMFQSVNHFIDDEIENLYLKVLQTLKENSIKEGKELKDLYMPYKIKSYVNSGFIPKKHICDWPIVKSNKK